MGEFYGSLQDISLPEVLGFLKGLNKTGSLRISQGGWTAEAALDAGQVTAASFADERGIAALEATMLALAGGYFTFTDSAAAPDQHNIDLSIEELQARLSAFEHDRDALAAAVPSLAAVPRVARAPGTSGEVILDGAAIKTLLAVNGERTIADIARSHGLVATARELSRLLGSGLISVDVPEAEAIPPRTREEIAEADAPETVMAEVQKTDVTEEPAAQARLAVPAENASAPASDEVHVGSNGQVAPIGAALAEAESPASAPRAETEVPEGAAPVAASAPCPKLGYVDDPANRYSRPTQLHRCFASGNAERVSTPEQRDLCLTNRFASCPRFIAGGATVPAPTAEVAEPTREPVEARMAVVASPEAPAARDLKNGGSPRSAPAREQEGAVAVQGPPAVSRSNPPVAQPPPEVAAVAAAAPAARTEVTRRADASQIPVETMPPRAAEPTDPAAGRKFAPALLIVTAVGVATLAVALFRASSSLPEVSDAEVARLATAVVNNPGSGVVSIPPAVSAPGSGGPSAPLRTAMDIRFSEPIPGWPDSPNSTAWWADGEYHVLARTPGQFVAIGAPTTDRFDEMVVTGTFRKVGGPPGGGYGLMIRDQGPGPRDGINQYGQYYVLEVGDRGEYGIWRREGDRWLDLIPWTQSELVPPGNVTNELTVQATGQELTFLINGRVLANLVGAVLRDGGVGIFIGGDHNEVVIERFVVQTP